ncbi:hypothetical protein [Salininema proteolyticum]|uniref:Uncharacterized protein n=1 Tax=Salininema proteolyticum TaxID=1607685 RepID=A0ABV8U312_9ACTN
MGFAPIRLLRAGVFTAACTTVSAAFHVAAGGHLSATPVTITAAALVAALAFAAAGRQRGPAAILASCAGAQTLLHILFNLHSPAPHPGHLAPSAGMILAHTAALTITAAWLHRGETALALFCDLIRALFATLTRLPETAPTTPPRQRPAHPDSRPNSRPRSTLLADARPQRGPPTCIDHS